MPVINSGSCRGRKLKTLEGQQTRPTPERLKEAVFSSIGTRIEGASFLDLFAGSGQMGLEAASRGAAHVVMVEKNQEAFAVLLENVRRSGLSGIDLKCRDASRYLRQASRDGYHFDFIYFDPPWKREEEYLSQYWDLMAALLDADSTLLLESDRDLNIRIPEPFHCCKTCRAGRSMISFYRKSHMQKMTD